MLRGQTRPFFSCIISYNSSIYERRHRSTSPRVHAARSPYKKLAPSAWRARIVRWAAGGVPTISPCGECVHCRSIAEDRHVDVIEMDAASHTQVDKMRELLDGMRYRPVSARYKIYVIDEVHMLSGHSFNALLKTLEEPPPDVKFIF